MNHSPQLDWAFVMDRWPLLAQGALLYIQIFRSLSLYVYILFIYFGLAAFSALSVSPLAAAIISVTLLNSAYVAEIYRSAFDSVDQGQTEASIALGLSRRHGFLDVVLPQAMRTALANQLIIVVKDSSVVGVIGVPDLMYEAQRPGGTTLAEVLVLLPLLRRLLYQRASGLSGGKRQMVVIARALIAPADLILLDEPFEGLAPVVVQEVIKAVALLRTRASIVIVEHKAELVLPMADRAYVMVSGRIAYEGPAGEVERDTALQARLLGVVHKGPELEAVVAGG
jgi:His/Glu/Gln/Arg/opine family amino acid ABC transporter permease subunit